MYNNIFLPIYTEWFSLIILGPHYKRAFIFQMQIGLNRDMASIELGTLCQGSSSHLPLITLPIKNPFQQSDSGGGNLCRLTFLVYKLVFFLFFGKN